MIYIGIDPGRRGALAALDDAGRVIDVLDMPDCLWPARAWLDGLAVTGDIAACIEQCKSFGPGGHRVDGLLISYGSMLGLCCGLDIDACTVLPRTWQAMMLRGAPKGATKGRSLWVAAKRWPEVELETKRGRVLDGRADALLLAEYLRLTARAETVCRLGAPK